MSKRKGVRKETLSLHFAGSDGKIKCLAQGHTIYNTDNEKTGNSGLTSRVQAAVCIVTLSPLGRFLWRANDILVWVADKGLSSMTNISEEIFKLDQLKSKDQKIKL